MHPNVASQTDSEMWRYSMHKLNVCYCEYFKSACTLKGHGGDVKKQRFVMYCVSTMESIDDIFRCNYVANVMTNSLKYNGSTQVIV